jgi:GNAT superfamily N-acetyltransferase
LPSAFAVYEVASSGSTHTLVKDADAGMSRGSAAPDEAAVVSALAIRSKAHWDYPPEQMSVVREELTLRTAQLANHHCHVAVGGAEIRGFYTLVLMDDGRAELEHIFVEPVDFGVGIGRELFDHACGLARKLGVTALYIQSDPNAAGFYSRLGARLDAEIPSSIPGRSIPCFAFTL